MAKQAKFDSGAAVRDISRHLFHNMPKGSKVPNKLKKPPKYKKLEED